MSGYQSGDAGESPEIPQGVIRSRSRWEGEQLEIEHQRQELQRQESKEKHHAAVDLQQFRNVKVGEGYQAKHVVRQAGVASSSQVSVKDMSSRDTRSDHNRKRKYKVGKSRPARKETNKTRLQRLLKSAALRRFRKELAKIEADPVKRNP